LFLLLFILLQLFTRNKGRDEDGQGGAVIMRAPGQTFAMDAIRRPPPSDAEERPLTDAQKEQLRQIRENERAREIRDLYETGKAPGAEDQEDTSSGCCC
jgi:hypothetical protein